jgi:hypothetical protein
MGLYVYTLRARKGNVVIDGVKRVANILAYAYKPGFGYNNPWEAQEQRCLTRVDNFWAGKDRPEYVVAGDKFEEGCEVFFREGGYPTSCYDGKFPGDFLGYLKKVGKTWEVSKDFTNRYPSEGF